MCKYVHWIHSNEWLTTFTTNIGHLQPSRHNVKHFGIYWHMNSNMKWTGRWRWTFNLTKWQPQMELIHMLMLAHKCNGNVHCVCEFLNFYCRLSHRRTEGEEPSESLEAFANTVWLSEGKVTPGSMNVAPQRVLSAAINGAVYMKISSSLKGKTNPDSSEAKAHSHGKII